MLTRLVVLAVSLASCLAANLSGANGVLPISNPNPSTAPTSGICASVSYPAQAWFTNNCGTSYTKHFGKSLAVDYVKTFASKNDAYIVIGSPSDQKTVGRAYQCFTRPTLSCSEIVSSWQDVDNRAGVSVAAKNGQIAIGANRRAQDNAPSQWLCLDQTHSNRSCLELRNQGLVVTMAANLTNQYLYDVRGTFCSGGACSIGTTVDFDPLGFLVTGGPSAYSYSGIFYRFNLQSSTTVVSMGFNSNISIFDYIGYNIDAGSELTGDSVADVIAGSPRNNQLGLVRIFVGKTLAGSFLQISNFVVVGDQLYARFGSAVLAYDVTGDGRADVFVSSVAFSTAAAAEVGKVTFFFGRVGTTPDQSKNLTFTGTIAGSWFGFSLARAGDLNLDGYNDVVIGAPWEGQSSNAAVYGAIYVLRGSATGPVASQRLTALQVNAVPAPAAFGISLAGGVDLLDDLAGESIVYPEVTVGAMNSESVYVMKTRSISTMGISITRDKLNVPVSGPELYSNVTFQICFDNLSGPSRSLAFNFSISFDQRASSIAYDRVLINSPAGCTVNTCSSLAITTELDITSPPVCTEVVLDVLKSVAQSTLTIPVLVNVTVADPVLWYWEGSRTATVLVPIQSNCSTPTCETDTAVTAFLTPSSRLRAGNNLVVTFSLSNEGDDAFEMQFLILASPGIFAASTLPVDPNQSPYICQNSQEQLSPPQDLITCSLSKDPTASGTFIGNSSLTFTTTGVSVDVDTISVNVSLITASNDTDLSNNVVQMSLDLYREADLRLQLSVLPSRVGLGQQAKYVVTITNFNGPNDAKGLILRTLFPCQPGNCTVSRLQSPLRLLGITIQDGLGNSMGSCDTSYVDEDYAFEVNFTAYRRRSVFNSDDYRPRRDYGHRRVRDTVYPVYPLTGNFSIDCTLNTLLNGNVAIVSYYVVVNENFLAADAGLFLYPMLIVPSPKLYNIAPNTSVYTQDQFETAFVLQATVPNLADPAAVSGSGLNAGGIAGAVVGGAVLLLIVCVVLYKKGFFKRAKRPDEYLSDDAPDTS